MDGIPLLEGEHRPGRWREIAAVARAITEQFVGVERPAFLDDRTHAWARADRLAWGEGEATEVDGAPFLTHLLTRAGLSRISRESSTAI